MRPATESDLVGALTAFASGAFAQKLSNLVPLGFATCVIQLLPGVLYGIGSSRTSWRAKLALGGGLSIFVIPWLLLADRPTFLLGLLLGFGYYGAVAAVVGWLSTGPVRKHFSGGAMSVFAGFAFVLAPAFVIQGVARVQVLILGWEMILAAVSFWREAPSQPTQPSLRSAVFFIVFHPCLVFTHKGSTVGPPAWRWRGVARLGLGFLAIVAYVGVLATWQLTASYADVSDVVDLASYGGFVLYFALRLLEIYCVHSGGASLHIGLFRLLGYELPERYRLPWLASSPADFWRRWNLYVADWFKHYVFNPLALERMRRGRWRAAPAKALALVAAFAACGAVHEYVLYAKAFSMGVGVLLAFLFQSLVVLGWLAAEGVWKDAARRVPWLGGRTVSVLRRICGRVALVHVMLLTMWLIVPALSGWGLPPALRALLGQPIVAMGGLP